MTIGLNYCLVLLTGKNYLQWDGTLAQLVVTEFELCKEILTNKDGAYLKPKFKVYAKKIFGNGL